MTPDLSEVVVRYPACALRLGGGGSIIAWREELHVSVRSSVRVSRACSCWVVRRVCCRSLVVRLSLVLSCVVRWCEAQP